VQRKEADAAEVLLKKVLTHLTSREVYLYLPKKEEALIRLVGGFGLGKSFLWSECF
jgi:hypothetical protein